MFSFFCAQDESRFANCQELKPLLPILKKLRKQVDVLNRDAESSGPTSIDAKKHVILSDLLKEVDALIGKFNNAQIINREQAAQEDNLSDEDLDNDVKEDNEILTLVQDLKALISDLNSDYAAMRTLATKRNDKRENVNDNIHFATTGTALVLACGMPLTFPVGVVAVYGAYHGNEIIRDLSGLSDLTPRSMRIINALGETLDKIEEQIYDAEPLVSLAM